MKAITGDWNNPQESTENASIFAKDCDVCEKDELSVI